MLTIFILPNFIHGDGVAKKRSLKIKKDDDLPSTSKSTTKNDECNEKDDKIALTSEDLTEDADETSKSHRNFSQSMNDFENSDGQHHIRKTDTNYLLKDLISKEVNKIKDETDNLSNMLKGKIEAANIEGLIDKTVNGIVELKDDLMRMNEPEIYGPTSVENLRKRNNSSIKSSSGETSVDTFLKKEIDAIKKETTVIPAVLSNANSAK